MTVTSRKAINFIVAAVAMSGGLLLDGDSAIFGSLVSSAEARVGRPLTPMSYAGVARRTTRRAVMAPPPLPRPAPMWRRRGAGRWSMRMGGSTRNASEASAV